MVTQQITHDPPIPCLTRAPLLNLVILVAQVPAGVELKSESQMSFYLLNLMPYIRYSLILNGLPSALMHEVQQHCVAQLLVLCF